MRSEADELEETEEVLTRLLGLIGNSINLKVLWFFYRNQETLDNITGIADRIGYSHVSTGQAITELVKMDVLMERQIGRSRVISLNRAHTSTQILFKFFEEFEKQDN